MPLQRRTRLEVQHLPSRALSTTHHDVRDPSAGLGAMVGRRGTQSRSPMLSPGGTGDRQPSDPSGRTQPCVPPTRGTKVPEQRLGYLQKCGLVKIKKTRTGPTNQRQDHLRQKHQRPARRATDISKRQKVLECGPTSLPQGSWNVTPAGTKKPGQNFRFVRFLGRSPCPTRTPSMFITKFWWLMESFLEVRIKRCVPREDEKSMRDWAISTQTLLL